MLMRDDRDLLSVNFKIMGTNRLQQKIIADTEEYVKQTFEGESSGHDWWHINRVRGLALKIAGSEGGNLFIIEMAALLHDLDDWKLNGKGCGQRVGVWLDKLGVSAWESARIIEVVGQVSFKGAGVETKATSQEARIVQDADRLDAIGAIGIARTFAYGGSKGRLIYDPGVVPEMYQSFEAYKKTTAPTINHFYEKLLLLKDRLNTGAAKKMAVARHGFMEQFLERFFNEWDNKG